MAVLDHYISSSSVFFDPVETTCGFSYTGNTDMSIIYYTRTLSCVIFPVRWARYPPSLNGTIYTVMVAKHVFIFFNFFPRFQ